MAIADTAGAAFNAETARLLRREALRRAAEEPNTASPAGLETVLERISREATEDAAERRDAFTRSHPSKP